MNISLALSVVAVLTLAMMAAVAYVSKRDWLAPSACAALLWCVYTALPLLGAPD
jgi:hypothetical protein